MSDRRDKQVDMLKRALAYAKALPDDEIHVCTRNDELCNPDEFAFTDQRIVNVESGWLYRDKDRIVVGIDEIRDHLEIIEDREVSIEDAKAVSSQVILIYTGARA